MVHFSEEAVVRIDSKEQSLILEINIDKKLPSKNLSILVIVLIILKLIITYYDL